MPGPKGDKGDKGDPGEPGEPGPQGPPGTVGTHEHDAAYSPIGHTHNYSATTHNHDAAYAPVSHSHDLSGYSPTSHTHNYAPTAHTHDYAATSHTHDLSGYSQTSHTHSGYAATSHSHVEADLPSTLATDTEVATAVTNHANAADPHPTYLTQTEGDARYSLAGAGGNDPRLKAINKTANQTTSGTGIMNVSDLIFAVGANETWKFEFTVDVSTVTGTAPTLNFSFLIPSGGVSFRAKRRQMTTATAETMSVVTAGSTGFGAGAVVANTRHTFEGTIVNGATAGNVQLQVTPGGTTPAITFLRGSGGFAVKLA